MSDLRSVTTLPDAEPEHRVLSALRALVEVFPFEPDGYQPALRAALNEARAVLREFAAAPTPQDTP